MKESITLKTMKEIKIISNPIRMKVLKNYYTYGAPATVKQMAVHMGEVPANIHYHVKKLLEIKVLELDHTESVNGIIAKFYVPTAKTIKIDDEDSDHINGIIDEKELILKNLFDQAKGEFVENMSSGDKHSEAGTVVYTQVDLSETELEEVLGFIKEISERKGRGGEDDFKKYLFFSGIVRLEK